MAISQFDVYAPGQFVSQYVPLPFNELMQAGAFRQKQLDDSLNLLEEKRAALDVAGGYSTQDRAKAFRELKNQKLDELSAELMKSGNVLGFRGKVAGVANQLASEYQTLKADEEYRKLVDQIRMKDPKAIYHGYDSELGQWQQQQGNFDPNWYKYTAYADVEKDWLEKGRHLKPDIADLYREGTDISYDENGKGFIRTTTGQRKYLNTNMQRVVDAARAHARYMIANKDTDETADYYFRSNKGNLKKTEEDIMKEIIDSWKIFAFDEENTTQGMKPVGQSRTGGGGGSGQNQDDLREFGIDLGQVEYQLKDYDFGNYLDLMDKTEKSRQALFTPEALGFNSKEEFDTFRIVKGNINIKYDKFGNIVNREEVINQLAQGMTEGGLPVGRDDAARYLMNHEIASEKAKRYENFHSRLLEKSGQKILKNYSNLSKIDKELVKQFPKAIKSEYIEAYVNDLQPINNMDDLRNSKDPYKQAILVELNKYDKEPYLTILKDSGHNSPIEFFNSLPKEYKQKIIRDNISKGFNNVSAKNNGSGKVVDFLEANNEEAYKELFTDKREKGNLVLIDDDETQAKRPELNKWMNVTKGVFGGNITKSQDGTFKASDVINNQVFNYRYIDPETGEDVSLVNGEYERLGSNDKISAMKIDGVINTRDGYYIQVSPIDDKGNFIKHKDLDKNLRLMVKYPRLDQEILDATWGEKGVGELTEVLNDRFNSFSDGGKGRDKIVTDGKDGRELIPGVPMIINRSDDGKVKATMQIVEPITGEVTNNVYEFNNVGEFAARIKALRTFLKNQEDLKMGK